MKITKTFFKQNFPKISKNSYKNINGKVLIIAGSKTMQGAAVLNVLGAYSCGAGMVALASIPEVIKATVCAVPQALVLPLGKRPLAEIKKYIQNFQPDVLVIGSGLSALAKDTVNILKFAKIPAVIDASSLTYLASKNINLPKSSAPYILTPHIGEMKKLLKQKTLDLGSSAKILAQKTGAVCLLKGPVTYISDGVKTYESHAGNCGLAKAGSGDVLAGIIGAIYARLLKKYEGKKAALLAAVLGTYLHGYSADLAAKEKGKTSLLATDVIQKLPFAIKNLLSFTN